MALNTFATPFASTAAYGEDGTTAKQSTSPPRPSSLARQSSDETQVQDNDVRELARTWTERSRRQSMRSEAYGSPFDAEKGSILDPDADNFNPRAWTKAMLQLQDEDDTKFKGRKAGVVFRNLNAYGYNTGADFQKTVGNFAWQIWGGLQGLLGRSKVRVDILRDLDGVIYPGELLVVLGPPGSGCSTFLKTLAGETHGFTIDEKSHLNYSGISYDTLKKNFRGESMYTAEQDVHFPMLTVGKTLYFAARARAPRFM
jgi:ATP-binding cassette, subfamily G (WHITE), member 2, PDR